LQDSFYDPSSVPTRHPRFLSGKSVKELLEMNPENLHDLMNKDIRGLQEYDVKPMICNMKFIGIITGFCSGCGLISLIQATFLTGIFDNPLSYSDETKELKKQEPQNKLNEIYVLGPIMSMLITTVKSLIIID